MKLTKLRIALIVIALVGIPLAAWALAPLFIETTANVPPLEGFNSVVSQGSWSGVDSFHFASGTATILTNGEGAYVLRIEEFRVRNGPDIHFFLSEDGTVGQGDVDLGSVPATTGSYNVGIPSGAEIDAIRYALVHCVPANFLFASARLA